MIKNFVFDTNVLLTNPHAIFRFGDNNVIIPITVFEELDQFKRDQNTLGRNARETARIVDRCREKGNLSKGVPLDNGGTLRVLTNIGIDPQMPFPTLGKTADSLILATALMLRDREQLPVVFVTGDTNLRLRADAVGLTAVNYEEDISATPEELYSGHAEVEVGPEILEELRRSNKIKAAKLGEFLDNQCVALINKDDPEHRTLTRHHSHNNALMPLLGQGRELWGITARNEEQDLAVDLLLDDSIRLVTLVGKAGTGKTLLAIAAGLKKVAGEGAYNKLVVARPIMPLGKEIGFLPGDLSEKLHPWMEPVFDNLELILKTRAQNRRKADKEQEGGKKGKKRQPNIDGSIGQIMASGMLEVEPLTYIRGRSLAEQFLIIDEAQNLTHHEVKTIITRAGEGTKVVLTGDPYQIDNPFLDSTSSGLVVAVERFKGKPIAGHMTLTRGERSDLAEMASNLL